MSWKKTGGRGPKISGLLVEEEKTHVITVQLFKNELHTADVQRGPVEFKAKKLEATLSLHIPMKKAPIRLSTWHQAATRWRSSTFPTPGFHRLKKQAEEEERRRLDGEEQERARRERERERRQQEERRRQAQQLSRMREEEELRRRGETGDPT